MSKTRPPAPAKLVIGSFMKNRLLFDALAKELSGRFGEIDLISSWLPFDFTDYYEREMGAPLYRRMLAFRNLIQQGDLADIKTATTEIENTHSRNGGRDINIDPGYMLRERFVLATGKNFTHRIYIGKGVYADLTLIYTKGAFRELPWTYPDYGADNMRAFLVQVRTKYVLDLSGEQ